MHAALVLTLIGRDRPGLVDQLAALVADHGGNWLESRMSRLGGEFAGILRLTVPQTEEERLRQHLAALGPAGLTVMVKRDDAPTTAPAQLLRLELIGQDRPGIVRQIARALAAQGANVEELVTECTSAPMTGEPIFKATVRLALPPGGEWTRLRSELERIAADLMVDLDLHPVVSPAPTEVVTRIPAAA